MDLTRQRRRCLVLAGEDFRRPPIEIAEQLHSIALVEQFPRALAEHPYNLSFIEHGGMQALFGAMHLLKKRA